MPQYLLSIYQPDGGPPPPEVLEVVMRDVHAVVEQSESRRRVGLHRRALPSEHRHGRSRGPRRDAHHRRPFRRGQGAHRRIPDHRRARSRRGARLGRQARTGDDAAHRGAAVAQRGHHPDRTRIPRGVRPRGGRPDSPVRRHRRRRRGRAGRVRRGGATVAGRRRATKSGRMDHHHRAQQGDRPPPPRGEPPGPACPGRAAARHAGNPRGGRRGRRPVAPDLHVLPSGARQRRAGRADAAAARRAHDRRDRARVSGARADDGAAAGAGEGQDPRGEQSPIGFQSSPTCQVVCVPCWRWST